MSQRKCLKDLESRIGSWGWLLHVNHRQRQRRNQAKQPVNLHLNPKPRNPIDIPLKDFSPEVRKLLIQGMVKGGKAIVVKKKKDKDEKSKEKK